MGKSIEQMTIEGKVEKQFVATYKTIVKSQPRVFYEACMAEDVIKARVIIVERLRAKGIVFQIQKVEEFVGD